MKYYIQNLNFSNYSNKKNYLNFVDDRDFSNFMRGGLDKGGDWTKGFTVY